MWSSTSEAIEAGLRFRISHGESALSFRELLRLWDSDSDFAGWYGSLLANVEFEAFFWEHPPLTTSSLDSDAEFVLIPSNSLARRSQDPGPFQPRFAAQPDGEILSFANLRGDATLVVPRPVGAPEAYTHLAAFLRLAPSSQVLSLWRVAARVVGDGLGSAPRWLSTAGLGVSWLHLRLDSRPKYYKFGPYRAATPSSTPPSHPKG